VADILLIEDEKPLRLSLSRMLERGGHTVTQGECLADARAALQAATPDLVIFDNRLPDGLGIDMLRQLRADGFDGVVVVITAEGTIENAVAAMRHGADDFLQKPLKLEELPVKVDRWLEQRKVRRRLELYERMERRRDADTPVLGRSPAWLSTLRLADRLAKVPLQDPSEAEGITLPTMLLTGETGVGKGVLARYIHQKATEGVAGGAHAPFVHVNCSALPPTLVEAELFGHERGAFTDARQARAGLFEMADGGTIFLDEISETPLELQSKLLLVVEQGRYRRVGATKDRTVRVRVVAASNADLVKSVEKGVFRRDLFYRLNSFTVHIPALRERSGDAVTIAEAMLDRLARRYGRPAPRLSDDARAAIDSYNWPGNVRELINTMQRVAMLCDGDHVSAEMLALEPARRPEPIPASTNGVHAPMEAFHHPSATLDANGLPIFDFSRGNVKAEEIERSLIVQALRHTSGNVSRAATLIGLTRASMRYRMEQYGLGDHTAQRELSHT
jgi:DNA-binding NtrC family response regulator